MPKVDLIGMYGRKLANSYREELVDLDGQLDAEWPDWRSKRPFRHLPYEAMLRVKKLMKRRSLILNGHGSRRMYVVHHPRKKTSDDQPLPLVLDRTAPVSKASPLKATEHTGPVVSLPHLAASVSRGLERAVSSMEVGQAIDAAPPGTRNLRQWCIDFLGKPKKRRKKAKKGEAKDEAEE